MLGSLPTIKIEDESRDGRDYIVINQRDFDPARHHEWQGAEAAAARRRAQAEAKAAAEKAAKEAEAKAAAEKAAKEAEAKAEAGAKKKAGSRQ